MASGMSLEDRVALLEEKMKAVEEFMVHHRHEEEFNKLFRVVETEFKTMGHILPPYRGHGGGRHTKGTRYS